MEQTKKDSFAQISFWILLAVTILHTFIIFLPLLSEQIQTGWNGGTSLELGVIYVIIIMFILSPALLIGLIYLIYSCFKYQDKKYKYTNWSLFILLTLEYILIPIFILY